MTKNASPKKKTITVVGLGYVGWPLFQAIARSKKYQVWGHDISLSRIQQLQKNHTRLFQKKTQAITSDPLDCIPLSDVVIFCVPTSLTKARQPDFRHLLSAVQTVGSHLSKKTMLIIESTVPPGTCEDLILPALEKLGLVRGRDFSLAHCPERLNPGDSRWNIMNIPRNIGGLTQKDARDAAQFYRSFLRAPIRVMSSLKEVESTKMVENIFRDVNIALVNEFAMTFDTLGIDVMNVLQGAATKPFSFLPHFPGCGVGGDCIATDPYYFLQTAKSKNSFPQLITLGRKINERMPRYVMKKLSAVLQKSKMRAKNPRILVLGLSYKPSIADTRMSPAWEILSLLKRKKYAFEVYDPYVPEFSTVSNIREGLRKTEGVIVCTAHPEFLQALSSTKRKTSLPRFIVDGRNCLDKEGLLQKGILYTGIGR